MQPEATTYNKRPQAALLSSPGLGHLIPVLELGKRLVYRHALEAVTVFVVTTGDSSPAEAQQLKTSEKLNIVKLPPVDVSSVSTPATPLLVQLTYTIRQSLPDLRSAISVMKVRPAALIVDQFGTEAFSVASEFNILKYVMFPCSARFLALTLYVPHMNRNMENQHVKEHKPLCIPGCEPIRFECTFEPVTCRDRDPEKFSEYVRMGVEIASADGVLVNTWRDLEPKTLGALKDESCLGRIVKAPVYPIGPLVKQVEPGSTNKVTDWLNLQPSESVIYVSFGSGGTMSANQTAELAWGLEMSQQRFVWVVRPPVEGNTSATFFTAGKRTDDGTPNYLPDGFLTRTKEIGLVVPTWASQSDILAHQAVGGFFSHCGWNSTLESMINGVPMIAWPLYAEQKFNSAMLVEHLGVAVRPEVLPSPETVVRREEIEKMVRHIMGVKSAERRKVKELKQSAEKALKNGGSSYDSLCQVAKECENSLVR